MPRPTEDQLQGSVVRWTLFAGSKRKDGRQSDTRKAFVAECHLSGVGCTVIRSDDLCRIISALEDILRDGGALAVGTHSNHQA